ncbi:MAG: TIGR04255 family protein [Candidatus Cloacimonetes bacterium]|jgi:uncharacterized protein (TIGR04255 family)|nr:TIGR04255 family protein [Candidatus Cloacimonadota bacterium]
MARYTNTPIEEVICEFRFAENTKWDMTVPGILFSEVREVFPHREQHVIQEINIMPRDPNGKTQIRKIDQVRFLNSTKKTFIQIGPRTLSINQLKPYNSWVDFKHNIEYTFEKLNSFMELTAVQRIGLRYINRIEIPTEENKVHLDTYFDFRPFCGPRLPQLHGNFNVRCIFPYFGERDLCNVELSNAISENRESLAFILSIDYFLAKPNGVQVTQSMEWVEEAHTSVDNLFDGCILPPLKAIFGEVAE